MELYDLLIIVVAVLVCVLAGYIMGFKAARPDDPILSPHYPDQGSKDEPDGDIWRDAMTKSPDMDERIKTR